MCCLHVQLFGSNKVKCVTFNALGYHCFPHLSCKRVIKESCECLLQPKLLATRAQFFPEEFKSNTFSQAKAFH